MATRSRIGIQLQDDSILSVYHHSDGYPQWLGRILTTHYNTLAKVSELIDGGDMTSCWTDKRWTYEGEQIAVQELGPQYYIRKIDGDCPPRLDADLCEYLLPDGSEEYAYLFRNGEWVCYHMHQFDNSKLPEVVEIPNYVTA